MGFLLSVASGALEGAAMEREGHRKESELVLQEQMAALRDMWKGQGAARAKAAQQKALFDQLRSMQPDSVPDEVLMNIVLGGNENAIKMAMERQINVTGPKSVDTSKLPPPPKPPSTLDRARLSSAGPPQIVEGDMEPQTFGDKVKVGLFGKRPDPNNFDKATDLFSKTTPGANPGAVRQMVAGGDETEAIYSKPGVSYTFKKSRDEIAQDLRDFDTHFPRTKFPPGDEGYRAWQTARQHVKDGDGDIEFDQLLDQNDQMQLDARRQGLMSAAEQSAKYSEANVFVPGRDGAVWGRHNDRTKVWEIQNPDGSWVPAPVGTVQAPVQASSTETRGVDAKWRNDINRAEVALHGLLINRRKVEDLAKKYPEAQGLGGEVANFLNDMSANARSFASVVTKRDELSSLTEYASELEKAGIANAELRSRMTQFLYDAASIRAGQSGRDISNSDIERMIAIIGANKNFMGDNRQFANASNRVAEDLIENHKFARHQAGMEKFDEDFFYTGPKGEKDYYRVPEGTGGAGDVANPKEAKEPPPEELEKLKKFSGSDPEAKKAHDAGEDIVIDGVYVPGKKSK